MIQQRRAESHAPAGTRTPVAYILLTCNNILVDAPRFGVAMYLTHFHAFSCFWHIPQPHVFAFLQLCANVLHSNVFSVSPPFPQFPCVLIGSWLLLYLLLLPLSDRYPRLSISSLAFSLIFALYSITYLIYP
jgi:hypothetical protein